MIKEVEGRLCHIRENTYGRTLEDFLRFFEEVSRDFPFLTERDVKIVHYGGERFKRTFGLEFRVPEGTEIPDSYQRTRLENIM